MPTEKWEDSGGYGKPTEDDPLQNEDPWATDPKTGGKDGKKEDGKGKYKKKEHAGKGGKERKGKDRMARSLA